MNSTPPTLPLAPVTPPAEFHLLATDTIGAVEPGGSALEPLVVPPGVSGLACERPDTLTLTPCSASTVEDIARFEPMLSRPNEPRLLIAAPARVRASINGLPAPRLALLSEGDRFQFDAGPSFRVALFYRPRLGAASAEVIGVSCPVCTIALAEGDRCLVCPCGTPLHAAPAEAVENALDCARLVSQCPVCERPVRLEAGYGELSHLTHE